MRVEYGRKNAFDVEVRVGVKKGIIMGIIVISCVSFRFLFLYTLEWKHILTEV